jgi:ankyrin repeat protein
MLGERSIRITVQTLLDCKADPNSPDVKGRTPLFSYAILDSPSTMDLLCSGGANPMHRDQAGMTPIHALFEVCSKRETAVLLVKKYHADVNAKDNDGMTALMQAAKAHVYVNVRILLQDLNANPLLCNNEGRDALWLARNEERRSRHEKVVIQMLEAKVREWSLK